MKNWKFIGMIGKILLKSGKYFLTKYPNIKIDKKVDAVAAKPQL